MEMEKIVDDQEKRVMGRVANPPPIPTTPTQTTSDKRDYSVTDRYITILDSGAGALNTILSIKQSKQQRSEYTIILDTGGFPYGTHSRDTLENRLNKLIKKFGINVFACNTAGTIFPNILSPVRYIEQMMKEKDNWVLLCTQLASIYYKSKLKELGKPGCSVRVHTASKFEDGKHPALNYKNYRCVLLACTHFGDYHINPSNIEVIDSAKLLAKHLPSPSKKLRVIVTSELTKAITAKLQTLVNRGFEVTISRKEVR